MSDQPRRAQPVPPPAPAAPPPPQGYPQYQFPPYAQYQFTPPAPPPTDDEDDERPRASTRRQPPGNPFLTWLSRLTSNFLGTLLAGVVLLLIVRAYLHWSVQSTLDDINRKAEERQKEEQNSAPRFTFPTARK